MNKVFSVLKETFLVLSFVLLGLGAVIGFLDGGSGEQTVAALFLTIAVVAYVGVFLMHSKNDIAARIGKGMALATMVMIGCYGVAYVDDSTVALIYLIAAILYLVYYIFLFVGKIAIKDESIVDVEDCRIEKLEKWHELLEKKIISEEEYEEQRLKILGLNKKKK